MSRVVVEWRSASKENYVLFCKKNPKIVIGFEDWKVVLYSFNEALREYILETGEKYQSIKRKEKDIKELTTNL
jgi:hypothetical protein